MGKLIICTGNIAKEAFLFPSSKIRLYSIEEICYFIYHNIYTINEGYFTKELPDFMEQKLNMPDTAEKLRNMINRQASLKDMVVTILCSADYYEELEIIELIKIMDKLSTISDAEKRKLRGDSLLQNRNYFCAAQIYYEILNDTENNKISDSFYGNILHNIGITKIHLSTYEDAAAMFKKAYEKNKEEDSLLACLICLKLGKKDAEFLKEADYFEIDEDSRAKLCSEVDAAMIEAEHLEEFALIEKAKNLKDDGRVDEYYEKLYDMIRRWKDDFKDGLV